MPEAVINYVGEMPYRPREGAVALHPFVPCFEARIGDEPLFKVWVQLSWEGSITATRQLERQALSSEQAERTVSRALVLYGTHRLEQFVTEWLSTASKPVNPSDVWNLTTEDVPQLLALTQEKTCGYQVRTRRDLFCTGCRSPRRHRREHHQRSLRGPDEQAALPGLWPARHECHLLTPDAPLGGRREHLGGYHRT